ncbi:MAG: GNAT family N-acetyltransferase [Patescibacteria group bacterium]|nr:GNAT family N-acetyltransferase [Patescibacteria group bacterium]
MNGIKFLEVTGADDNLLHGFSKTYQEAFGGSPYYETYTDEQVYQDVWSSHLQNGIVILALKEEQVIGFGCALPFRATSESIRKFLLQKQHEGVIEIDLQNAWYMSELGVSIPCRGQGIGYGLIKMRLLRILDRGDSHYFMRTAAKGSNSRHMYERIGSKVVCGSQNVSATDQVQVNQSQSLERIYLFGSCEEALQYIS